MTSSGVTIHLRPASIHDAAIVRALYDCLGEEDLAFRFLGPARPVRPDQIIAMLEIDHRSTEHLIAFTAGRSTPVASLLIASDQSLMEAEVAISVAREWRNKGIGWTLLRHAVDLARARGLKRLRSIENRANRDAIEVERAIGFRVSEYDGQSALVLVEAELG